MAGPRKRADRSRKRTPLAALAVLLPLALAGGCRATVGGRDVFFRVSREVPPMVQEGGDGARVEVPGVDPEGDAVFVFVRGRL